MHPALEARFSHLISPLSVTFRMSSSKAAIRCKYCRKDVVRSFAVECAECENFILCTDCFSAGVELHPHKNTHKYKVSDCLEFPLLVKDWTVSEELALLEGIERHGMGNWKTISDFINTNKTTKAVEEHYWELYMGVHGHCLPATFMWKDQHPETAPFCTSVKHEPEGTSSHSSSSSSKDGAVCESDLHVSAVTAGYTRGEPVKRDEGFAQLSHWTKATSKADKQELRDKLAQLPGSDLPGFFPLRGDFDYEYENDADKMLADMEFSLDEHPSERELKLQVIRIYNHKLQERNRRKDFVIERGLVDFKLQQQQDKRRTKEERDLVGRLRVFARFQSKEEHEALVEGLLRAAKLRQQIELYRTYRQMGVRTLEQAKQYEANKRLREKDAKARKHRESAPYLFQSSQASTQASLTSSQQNQQDAEDGGKLAGRRRGRDSSSTSLQEDGANASSRKSFRGAASSSTGALDSADANTAYYNSAPSRGSGEQAPSGAYAEDPAVVARAPGGDLLSDLELQLCAQVPMLPLHYLAAKDALVREAYRNGSLTQEGVKRLLKFDADGAEKIYDFFVKEMLVNEPPKRGGDSAARV